MNRILATCRNCGKTSPCLEKDMEENLVTMPDFNRIVLTQWICPECLHIHIVQLDDDSTKKLFEQFKLRMSRFRRNASMGKGISLSDVNAMDALQKSLDDARSALNARYVGSVYQLGEQKFKLELCPPDARISGEKESQKC